MPSQKLKISIFFILAFFILVAAKPHKKIKKVKLTPFQKLKKEYLVYKNSPNIKKDEMHYKEYLIKFEKFSDDNKEDVSMQSNYYIADINEKLFELTNNEEYIKKSYNIYLSLSKYSNSYGLAAQKKVEILSGITQLSSLDTEKRSDHEKADGFVKLKGIKHSDNDTYTRVIIELGNNATFEHTFLKGDPINNKPNRIVIDIKNATYQSSAQLEPIILDNRYLEKVRVGQFKSDTLRIVLDLKDFASYRAFSEKESYQIIVDIYGNNVKSDNRIFEDRYTSSSKAEKVTGQLPVKVIVIDMGHGAHDPGAIGYKGLKEKDITLDIGLKLGKILKESFPNIEVIFTREDDRFLKLEERTAIANDKKADLFISIHANASKNKEASGVETYFLNFTKEERAKEVVARENASSIEGVDEVQEILKDLIVTSKYNESSLLASMVQSNLVKRLQESYGDINDLGVKQGPFYVLLGAAMPSILVETSFISSPKDGAKLANEIYRYKIAEGIYEGVKEYMLKTVSVNINRKITSLRQD